MNWILVSFFVIGALALLLCLICWQASGTYDSPYFMQASDAWMMAAAACFATGFVATGLARSFGIAFDASVLAVIPYMALRLCFAAIGRIRDRDAYEEAAIVRKRLREESEPIVEMPACLAAAGSASANLVWFMACACLGIARPMT